MIYFKKVKIKDKVFGLVYGAGKVVNVWEDSFYTFEVEYKNGMVVPYTPEGIPAWSNGNGLQTVFYKSDIDLFDYDFSPSDKIISIKKIIKLRDKRKLEVRCPSGIWQNLYDCPMDVSEQYLEDGNLHLFRKSL